MKLISTSSKKIAEMLIDKFDKSNSVNLHNILNNKIEKDHRKTKSNSNYMNNMNNNYVYDKDITNKDKHKKYDLQNLNLFDIVDKEDKKKEKTLLNNKLVLDKCNNT